MNRISLAIITALLVLGTVVGCSILKGNDTEKKVKNYLTRFAVDLQQSDSLAAEHFRTDHSSWALSSALQALRNEVESPVSVQVMFPQALVTLSDSILVRIPVTMLADSVGVASQRITNLEMTLTQQDTTFVITRWNGEDFYESFWAFSNAITSGQNAHKIRESRGHFYERAVHLQETYDSVIWFANTESAHYYYVIKGQWEYPYGQPLKTENYRMGLVDEAGKEIIPVEYDLIGIPGHLEENMIEVKNAGKYGYFNLTTGQLVIPTEYDWLIPYESGIILVRNDSGNGWMDAQYVFHEGYPDPEAEAYVKGFKFLPKTISMRNEDASYLEIPSERYAAIGYTIPLSFYSYLGVLQEIEGGYTGDVFNEEAEVEYKEANLSFFEKAADMFSALIMQARDSYVYSREGFYDHTNLSILDQKGTLIAQTDLYEKGDISFKVIDSTLLEIKIVANAANMPQYYEVESTVESNTPTYAYFSIGDGPALTQLKSNRTHLCTQFVKLDSTYVTGDFMYHREGGSVEYEHILSNVTLERMRNDILAEYGYIFGDQQTSNMYKYDKWYQPRYHEVQEFDAELSDIDRHNLAFLAKILGSIDQSMVPM